MQQCSDVIEMIHERALKRSGPIPIARPDIQDEEIRAVIDVLRSGMLAQGKVVDQFESMFSGYIGVGNTIAVSSGTAALDLALKALEISAGDEVITTPFTFISTANAILYQGAKPVFADIDDRSFNIDPGDVLNKITGKTKAIIGVHLFGHPFDLEAIQEICEDYNLLLVEDCAQAHGAEYNSVKVGSFGSAGCFSFYPTKNMTTGEGGMITSNDDEIVKVCGLLRNHGQDEKYLHTMLGYNYRMTDIQAAIGIVQLKKVNRLNEMRIKNAEYLNKHIKVSGLELPQKRTAVKHVYHQYAVTVNMENGFPLSRDEFMTYLREKNIGCAVHYPRPVHKQPLYQGLGYTDKEVNCPVATKTSAQILSLPIHPALSREDLTYIAETVNSVGE
ncbi:MAG: UDP-4-amino-4-deoxy-L-arabinose--oxoglutarate aminotransferase [Candidatus Argoarchaeum ethanivorans]|uniref:UDP-4-amino-4-deoxy-L-arabinose--oxoglutarate aminotransferase n=1 Tax=Candidatus Argoarchaeum ethanivorans TaxID=2608793 RepID=A0A811T8R4_9EURY|nr:MAG: UDP-4-amino-4-deoxy-L-arabinose--oxoglutarate aminotransferase [Candidatus Argoarchaeum ethanivorans]